jgi:outer membrane protein
MRSLLLVPLVLLCAGSAAAGKIGFVDAERAVVTVDEGRIKVKELEDWATPQRERVERLAQRANELGEQLDAQRHVATPENLSQLEQEVTEARRAFEEARRGFERELEQKQNEFLAEVAVKVGRVASDYAEANDFDAVFVLKAQPLVYVAESADLTDTVIRLYNERFPAAD